MKNIGMFKASVETMASSYGMLSRLLGGSCKDCPMPVQNLLGFFPDAPPKQLHFGGRAQTDEQLSKGFFQPRTLGAIHHLVLQEQTVYPYALFNVLQKDGIAEVLEDKEVAGPDVFDAISKQLLDTYETDEKLTSPAFAAEVLSLAAGLCNSCIAPSHSFCLLNLIVFSNWQHAASLPGEIDTRVHRGHREISCENETTCTSFQRPR